MAPPERARIYLVTPPILTPAPFAAALAAALDAAEVACVRLALAAGSEAAVTEAAGALAPVCRARDVPLVLADHLRLAARLGLDGVHLGDGARRVRAAREALGARAIVGAFAGASRHEAMVAAEIGADYVSFGPVGDTGLGDGALAPLELFAWWAEMIETPSVAEGGVAPAAAAALGGSADFVALGGEIWSDPDPVAALRAYAARLAG